MVCSVFEHVAKSGRIFRLIAVKKGKEKRLIKQVFETNSENKLIYSVHEKSEKDWVSVPHFHNGLELVFHLEKSVKVFINGEMIDLHGNEIAVVNPFDVHYFKLEKGSQYYALRINKKLLGDFYEYCKNDSGKEPYFPKVLKDEKSNKLIFDKVQAWHNETNNITALKTRGYIDIVMGELISHYKPLYKVARENGHGFEVQIIEYLHSNYTQNITLDSLSKKFGYSKNAISKKLHKLIDWDLRSYLNELRLANVKRLLREENDITIEDAAYSSGFMSMSTYYRVVTENKKKNNGDLETH